MTMSSSSTHNSSIITNSNNEALVDKLQDALAAFRRERDELHRQKMLTEERLRLLQEEHASLHQTTSTTAEKLSQMEASASSSKALEELKALEVQVARLQQEVSVLRMEASVCVPTGMVSTARY
jgi:predicted  nucleic acid-binding Zn-ribbon protein